MLDLWKSLRKYSSKYRKSLDKLLSLIDFERCNYFNRSLDVFLDFLSQIGNPHLNLPCSILIVGTKGKGSVGYHLVKILVDNGYKVGLYTSPHLIDFRERIQINFEPISGDRFADYIDYLWPYREGRKGWRSVFEFLTAIAILYFIDEKVDFCVFEAGLGGRFDATNVINQKITIITLIDFDHEKILGNTIDKIAFEKASVIKEKNYVFTIPQKKDAFKVIYKVSKEKNAILKVVKPKILKVYKNGSIFKLGKKIYFTSASGIFQVYNSALAFKVAEKLNIFSNKVKINPPGRMEIMEINGKIVIFDSAHNPISVKSLVESLRKIFKNEKFLVIFGANKDKNIKEMLKNLLKVTDMFIFTRVNFPKAENPKNISEFVKNSGIKYKTFHDLKDAFKFVEKHWEKINEKILITGSFYLTGEWYKYLLKFPAMS